jgi:hypothetical protein
VGPPKALGLTIFERETDFSLAKTLRAGERELLHEKGRKRKKVRSWQSKTAQPEKLAWPHHACGV